MVIDYFQIFTYFYVSYAVKYTISCGFVYFTFWKLKKSYTEKRRIQKIDFDPKDIRRDILSAHKNFFYMTLLMTAYSVSNKEAILRYINYSNYSLKSFFYGPPILDILSWLAILILTHDTCFYWSHRLLHTRFFFKHIHYVHHLSKNPNPFTSALMHPLEGVHSVLWVILMMIIFQPPPAAWLYFSIIFSFSNSLAHSGLEFLPQSWREHFLLKFINSPTNHNYHHKAVNANYGYFFTAWDRIMGTGKYESDQI